MYTRIYQNEEKTVTIPENYDGNAFRDDINNTVTEEQTPPLHAPWDNEVKEPEQIPVIKNTDKDDGIFGGLFKKLPIHNILGSLGFKSFSKFEIGNEEILIIGIALFLFFSKCGDRELGLMLLLLLFIK